MGYFSNEDKGKIADYRSKMPPILVSSIAMTKVETRRWSNDHSFLTSVVQSKRPILIKGSSVSSWKMRKWDLNKVI